MIPKTIHYCWFGGKPLPKSALKCINSWKKFFPDYEIKEWNETNYDVRKIAYTAEAYDVKKYAFVSDYARFDILYQYGGVYFDTDVEVIRSFEDILDRGPFVGCEVDGTDCKDLLVNPGLGIGATAGMTIYKEILDYYRTQRFVCTNGALNQETVVTRTTNILKKHGLKNIGQIQYVAGLNCYPKEYFNPLNSNTGVLLKTENTHSIHWYSMTWLSGSERMKSIITRPVHRILGEDIFSKIYKGCRK